jgi:hypothetical protein
MRNNTVKCLGLGQDGHLYAGTNSLNGILKLENENDSNSWTNSTIGTSIESRTCLALVMGPDGHLYGLMQSRGVWRLDRQGSSYP